jgi:hypothetical protein
MFVPPRSWQAEASLSSGTNKIDSLRHNSSDIGFQEPQLDGTLERKETVKEEQWRADLRCFAKRGGICSGTSNWDGQWHLS